jgi:hypothetical protein
MAKSWFDMFMDPLTGAPKGRSTPKPPKPKYEWVREPRYRGQDTTAMPPQYPGNGRWVKKRVK